MLNIISMSPELAGRFFSTSATWEALNIISRSSVLGKMGGVNRQNQRETFL